MHYSFKDGVIQEHDSWQYAAERGIGTFTYSPKDAVITQWTRIIPIGTNQVWGWERCNKVEVPKEFLAALLLLGVPI